MRKLRTFRDLLINNPYGFVTAVLFHLGYIVPDRLYLKFFYRWQTGNKLNLSNPQTFTEKLQWIKLYDRNPQYTVMVDKYAAKGFVSKIIGEEYIIKTIGLWDSFDQIDFNQLPEKFVLKCTHDSGGLVICRDKSKLNLNDIKQRFNNCLKTDYYLSGREWPYKNVPRRIIAEELLEDCSLDSSLYSDLKDYKFFCFNGVVKFFKIDFNRETNHRANYYDLNKKLLPFGEVVCPPDFNRELPIPSNVDQMITLAEKLSKGIPFLRVDFYDVNNTIFFGELTFFPHSGIGKFVPEEYDRILGEMIKINNNEN